jgi:hypothetical protein
MQLSPSNSHDYCSVSEKSRKELVSLMRNNKEKSYALKIELKAFISYLPSNKKKFKIEDMFLKEDACKIRINSTRKKLYKDLLMEKQENEKITKTFYYKESNEMLSVTQFMSKYMDHLNMK